MEHDKMDDSRWVDDRLASLDPGGWRPDSSAALTRLQRRGRADNPARRHRLWVWATLSATAAAVAIGFLLLSTTPACANPLGCKQTSAPSPAPPPTPAPPASPVAKPSAAVKSAGPTVLQVRKRNFKESGSPMAPLTCEVYTDYQCPHCAAFYLETAPQLMTAYVQTGKVRLVHRDFPLPQHPYARLAAQFANAAGQLGYYQPVVTRLFQTQGVWSGDGDVAHQVAPVLPPAILEKVRDIVQNDAAVDDSMTADIEMAYKDHLNQTPTLVIVSKGSRQVLPGNVTFTLLKSYLDELLARQ